MKKQTVITPGAFCAEYHKETANGRVTFTQAVCRRFCNAYTHIDYDMLNDVQKQILKSSMADLSNGWRPYHQWDGKRIDIRI